MLKNYNTGCLKISAISNGQLKEINLMLLEDKYLMWVAEIKQYKLENSLKLSELKLIHQLTYEYDSFNNEIYNKIYKELETDLISYDKFDIWLKYEWSR